MRNPYKLSSLYTAVLCAFAFSAVADEGGGAATGEVLSQSRERRVVKKITAAIVCGKVSLETLIDHNRAHPGETMPLFNIIGMASDSQPGQTALGPYVKLFGSFKAVNCETGEEFRSGCAIIPGSGNDLVYGALKALGEQGGVVPFAFKVGVLRDQESAVGYVYTIDQVTEIGQADPLADFEKRLALPRIVAKQLEHKQENGKKKAA